MKEILIWIIFGFNLWLSIILTYIQVEVVKSFKSKIKDEKQLSRQLLWSHIYILLSVIPTILGFIVVTRYV